MPSQTFPVVDLQIASQSIQDLHDRVLRTRSRVEITRADTGESCVLISKVELDALEESIEMLGSSDLGVELHDQVASVARLVSGNYQPFAQA